MTSLPAGAGSFLFRDASGNESARLADLVAHATDRSPILDEADLADRVLLAPPRRRDQTPYAGVRVLHAPAAETLEPSEPPRVEGARASATLRAALERTVADSLEGVSRVAVLTGGGVDSSALLALVLRHMRERGGTAFGVALDFAGPGDDRPYRASLAAHLGCEILTVAPEDAAGRFDAVERGVDAAPLTWPGATMEIEALARAREHGAEVVLTGVGADELFDGDPRALADVARAGHPIAAVRSARRLRGFDRPRAPALHWVVRPLLAAALPRRWRLARARRAPTWAPAWAGPVLHVAADAQQERSLARALRHPGGPRRRYGTLVGAPHRLHLAWLRHQEQVAAAIPRRDPFLTPSLARVVTAFPPALLLRGDVRRGLFREACRELLPRSIVERQDKASFEPAFARCFLASDGPRRMARYASLEALAELGLAQPSRFREPFARFASDPTSGWEDVWPTLAVESFLRNRGAGS